MRDKGRKITNSRPAWGTERVQGQLGKLGETLSQTEKGSRALVQHCCAGSHLRDPVFNNEHYTIFKISYLKAEYELFWFSVMFHGSAQPSLQHHTALTYVEFTCVKITTVMSPPPCYLFQNSSSYSASLRYLAKIVQEYM